MQKPPLIPNVTFWNNKRSRQTFITLCRLFISFVYLTRVSLVAGNDCPFEIKPIEINPERVVVRYGSSVFVNCSTNVTHDGIGWEASEGSVPMTTDKLITWSVSNLTEWGVQPQCYVNTDKDQCIITLPVTIYKTPDSVSIGSVDHTGPMTEGFQYQLQCDIVNVAPAKNLIVKWYKGDHLVHHETFTDTIKTPVNKISRLQITPNRADDGVQYRCEAELELGADGPQPPPTVTSKPLNITVHFQPAINKDKLPSEMSVFRGYPVVLVCEAEGNPKPTISWSPITNAQVIEGNLTITDVKSDEVYTCTANNSVNTTTSEVKLFIKETPDSVSISSVDHTGPMNEGVQYQLQCDIVNVAPVKNLIVKWYKGETLVHHETFTDNIKTPVNKTSTYQITPNRADDGVQYRCEAELELGADGPQPPPTVTSKPLNITVHFKPVINKDKLPSEMSVFRGYPVVLVCEAEGNPKPTISWSPITNAQVIEGNLTIAEVKSDEVYTCTANNSVSTTTKDVKLAIKDIFINHTGPMTESSTYKLQCHIPNVVRVKIVSVKWYKGERLLPQETFNDSSSTELTITPNRTDDGAQYRCEAELNDGSQLKSKTLNIKVYYKPVINEVKLPSKVPVFRGYSVVLVCEAEGNPKPTISWSPITNAEQVIDGNLTITEATSQNLICNATNDVASTYRNVTVVLKEDYLPLIAGLVAVTVAVISVIFVFIYSIYYKKAKMGHYSLKDAKPSEQNGNIAQNGKVNPLPMKKFSQSDIFA